MEKARKITMLGAGNVGATIAYAIMNTGAASEILFVDINKDKAEGEAQDLVQGTSFCPPVNVRSGDYKDAVGSDIVIVTVGAGRKPGQSRLDLVHGNIKIINSVVPQIEKYAPDAIYIIVSNPVDILTYAFIKGLKKVPAHKVIGSGTMLDSSRLRSRIARDLSINPQQVVAHIYGEHGDSALIPWSLANVEGVHIEDLYAKKGIKLDKAGILDEVHKAGGEIIRLKGATFYAIGLSVANLVQQIVRDTKSLLTVSSLREYEGVGEVCVSLPSIVGINGIEEVYVPKMTKEEETQLLASAKAMREVIDEVEK